MSHSESCIYRFIVRPLIEPDPRSAGLRSDAHALGFHNLGRIVCNDLYFIEGQLQAEEAKRLALELLSDLITETVSYEQLPAAPSALSSTESVLEVALRPGVTDPVAAEIVRAAHEMGIQGVLHAATGWRYTLSGENFTAGDAGLLAQRLLANPVIHRYAMGEIEPVFPQAAQASAVCQTIALRDLDEEGLLAVSRERRAALDLAEMQAVQAYCRREGRDLTDVEFEMIAQTWSEHCVHKTFKGKVTVENGGDAYPGGVVDNLMKTYIRAATEKLNQPWLISVFKDNAGIVDLDGVNEVSFKVETHNHPSAIEPFGGANTGVGGVIRDVIGVSAKPIAATDILCFGPQDLPFSDLPAGVLHPRRIFSGVVGGVQDYGNKIGLPTVNGAIWFDRGYTSNTLVFCGCVGIAPQGAHPRTPNGGDHVVVIGGRTGRDGLRGATFSSMTMDAQTGEVSGASVQIGVPITEKGLIEVVLEAREARLYTAITDCGAGGLSSAVGEMASISGGDVDLALVPLKYPGLEPWEIWLSEAQERMVLAVPERHLAALRAICEKYDTEMTVIGTFNDSGRTRVRMNGQIVLDLENEFLHEGIPQRQYRAVIPSVPRGTLSAPEVEDAGAVLLRLLSHANIASKSRVIRIYDHEIQGGTLVKPLTGAQNDGPSNACVLKPLGAKGNAGIVLSNGLNPEYGKLDAYRMAVSALDEAVRNAVAVGADPDHISVLDNFCWGDPTVPETMGTLLEASRACLDAALAHQTPFISGKDSFNNEYLGMDGKRHAIPPTLLISAMGVLEDVTRTVTMDLKEAGNPVFLVGDFAPRFGGSHYNLIAGQPVEEEIPAPSDHAPEVYRNLFRAIRGGMVRACHDLSEGGLGVTAAEMCIGGRLGMDLSLPEGMDPARALFGETNGCLLVEVRAGDAAQFARLFAVDTIMRVANVRKEKSLSVQYKNHHLCDLPVDDMVQAWS